MRTSIDVALDNLRKELLNASTWVSDVAGSTAGSVRVVPYSAASASLGRLRGAVRQAADASAKRRRQRKVRGLPKVGK
jgi:hypothetical protein